MDLGGIATMGGGGPMVTGQWINQRTGEKVIVRDSYMDGENMYVTLTNGRTITMEEFQDYIQMSEEEYDTNGNKKLASSTKPVVKQKKSTCDPSLVFDGLDTNQKTNDSNLQQQLLSKEIEEFGTPVQEIPVQESQTTSSAQDMIIKILEKTETPKLSLTVNWDEYPLNELKMLKDYFNVSNDDISIAIMKMYINMDSIKETVTNWVNDKQK